MKAITYIAIGGVIILGGKYILSLKEAERKIVVVVTGKKDKISVQGISIIIKYNIKNPTDTTVRMTPPLVKLSINDKLLATSNMQMIDIPEDVRDKSGKIIIRAFKETGDIASSVSIPWISVAAIAPDLITRLKGNAAKDQITLKIEVLAKVYTLVGSFPYEQISNIKL
jgi:hypothetical protein